MITLKVAEDYTKSPGGRFIREGDFSGEDFRENCLFIAFKKAIESNERLVVDLDGGYGYGSSFLEEAFGGLVRKTKDPRVRNIKIVSEEEPKIKEDIIKYIEDAIEKEGLGD